MLVLRPPLAAVMAVPSVASAVGPRAGLVPLLEPGGRDGWLSRKKAQFVEEDRFADVDTGNSTTIGNSEVAS